MIGQRRLPQRVPLPGIYIEPGPDTPPALRFECERRRAATVLPIPYREPPNMDVRRDEAMKVEAIARGWAWPRPKR